MEIRNHISRNDLDLKPEDICVEFTSSKNAKPQKMKLGFALSSFSYVQNLIYRSKVVETKNKRSIIFSFTIEDIAFKKHSFLDYRVRWQVDDNGAFKSWETPQFLGETRLFGFGLILDNSGNKI